MPARRRMHLYSLVCELHGHAGAAARLGSSHGWMRGFAPFGAPRCVTGVKRDAHDRSQKRSASTLPTRLAAACELLCQRASADSGADLKQAESFVGEREAAVEIGIQRPKPTVGCLKPLERVPGAQRCRWKAKGLCVLIACEMHLAQAAGVEQAARSTGERKAAAEIAAHAPKLSMGCMQPPEECQ